MNTPSIIPSLITFIIVLYGYYKTLMPSIPGGDSGELVAESCELGTAHPPGYPLYTLLVHLISIMPKNMTFNTTIAYRANFFCAILSALSSSLITSTIYNMKYYNIINVNIVSKVQSKSNKKSKQQQQQHDNTIYYTFSSICGGTLYGFSPLVWTYAVGSEVFAMNNFFASYILYLTCKYVIALSTTTENSNPLLHAYYGSFIFGLGLCNQHTLILYEIPLILYILYTLYHKYNNIADGGTYQLSMIVLKLTISFILGLSPYTYLYWSDKYNLKRGSWGDSSTLDGFFKHFRRADYGTFQLFSGTSGKNSEGLIERLIAHMDDFIMKQTCLNYFVIVLLCIGIYAVITSSNNDKNNSSNRNDQHYFKYTYMYTYMFYMIVFHALSNLPLSNKLLFGVHARFWMQPNIILFIYIGIGIGYMIEYIIKKYLSFLIFVHDNNKGSKVDDLTKKNQGKGDLNGSSNNNNNNNNNTMTNYILNLLIATSIIYMQMISNYHNMDQHDNYYLNNYALGMLKSLPKNSLFITNYDQQWTASRYLQICEGIRGKEDVYTVNLSMMTFQWFHKQRHLYPKFNFIFNGKEKYYLARMSTKQYKRGEAFSFLEFLNNNYDNFPGGIYLGGKVGFNEETIRRQFYEEIPHGLLTKFQRIESAADKKINNNINKMNLVSKYYKKHYMKPWNIVNKHLKFDGTAKNIDMKHSIDLIKYGEETWESTVYIDYWDHRIDNAAYLLDRITSCKDDTIALKNNFIQFDPNLLNTNKKLASLIKNEEEICTNTVKHVVLLADISKIFEEFFVERDEKEKQGIDMRMHKITPSMYKNVGIAYSRIVQSKVDIPNGSTKNGYPLHMNVYNMHKKHDHDYDYKNHASLRTLETWKAFVEMPKAKEDPSYGTILNVVNYLTNVDNGKQQQRPGGGESSTSTTKKKKKKRKRKKRKGKTGK